MRFLSFVRLTTVAIAVPNFISSLPEQWTAWLESRLCHSSSIYETGYSTLLTLGQVGVCITAPLAVVIAFAAVGRFTWGTSALSWCCLLMGACLLVKLELGLAARFLCIVTQVTGYAWHLCFASPLLVFAAFLRYGFIQRQIEHPIPKRATDV